MAKKLQDFTTGDPGKELLIFSWPLILSMILQNLYNMADSVVVGRFVGDNALAAVGTCGSVTLVVLMLITGVTQGMSVIISQFFGAKDELQVKKTVVTSLYVITVLSIVFSIVGVVIAPHFLKLIRVPDAIMEDAITYLRIIFAGSLATAMYNMANSMSRSFGDSVTPMIVLIITSILNVVLNILFVTQFHMGVAGVAYATILATIISAIACWMILWKKIPLIHPTRETAGVDKDIVKMLVKIGIPSALQSSTVSLGALIVQTLVNGFGTTVMAAYAAATKIEALISYPPGGITGGMQVFAGQNVGAGKFERVKEGFKAAIKIIAIYSVFSAIVMIAGGKTFMGFFTSEGGKIIEVGFVYLVITGIGVFFCGVVFLARSTLIGAGDASAGVTISVMELIVRGVSAFLLSRTSLGYIGVFLGTPIGWIVAGAYGMYRYKRGKWKEKRLVKD